MKPLSEANLLTLGKYFSKLAEKSEDVFWVRSIDYKTLLYISPAYEEIWGLSCQSMYDDSESWTQKIHPEDKNQLATKINQIISNPQDSGSHLLEYRIIASDNMIRRIREICFPLFDDNHQHMGFGGVAKEFTQEKQRLAELEQASNYFRFFAEKVHAVFWARDDSCNRQIYLSPGYEKVWGRSRDSLYSNPDSWLDTLHPDDREPASNAMRFQALDKVGPNVHYENRYRIHTPKGEVRWIKDTSFPIQDENNNFIGFAGVAEDVTKEVLHEQELREAKMRAEVANQAKSDFLAMISHELRTPLNAILGMAQILKTKDLPVESQEYIDVISSAGNSLLSLVSDILDFARLEAGKLSFFSEPFDLLNAFLQVVHSLQYQAREKGIQLKLEYTSDIPKAVIGDVNRVRQVLMNLLSNALKFTEEGQINVKVSCTKKSKSKAVFVVKVQDTGIGIKEDKLSTLFDKFNQIDSIYHRKHRGIGLGLAITKELIEAMGGKITVKSEYGKGSEFCFVLTFKLQTTRLHQPNIGEPQAQHLFPHRSKFNVNILLVEDNLINQKIAKMMLEDFGCHVDVVDNGKEVLSRIPDLLQYQLIFMDVGLPDISGFDIVTALRKEPSLKKIPIVAMTAHILERDRQQAFAAGMNKVVAKPISYDEIEGVLEEYCCVE